MNFHPHLTISRREDLPPRLFITLVIAILAGIGLMVWLADHFNLSLPNFN